MCPKSAVSPKLCVLLNLLQIGGSGLHQELPSLYMHTDHGVEPASLLSLLAPCQWIGMRKSNVRA
jgi:hypothetical protein